jgi:hypothetical protein
MPRGRTKTTVSFAFRLWCIAAGMGVVLIAGLILRV